jgi:DNA modification methylase
MAFSGIHPSVVLASHKLAIAEKKLQTQINWLILNSQIFTWGLYLYKFNIYNLFPEALYFRHLRAFKKPGH